MKNSDEIDKKCIQRDEIYLNEPSLAEYLEATEIRDAEYKKADIYEVVKEMHHLDKQQKQQLKTRVLHRLENTPT